MFNALMKKRDVDQRKGSEVCIDGEFGNMAFREVRKCDAMACRSLIETNLTWGVAELYVQYRDIGRYMIDYLAFQEAKYCASGEEAIAHLMNLQWALGRRVDKRLKRYGNDGKETGDQKRMGESHACCKAIPPQARRARIQAIHMKKRIGREDDSLIRFVESRGIY